MADTLALTKLYDDVVARFAADGTAVPNKFGWRSPAHGQAEAPGNRIVWYPGDPRGQLGKLGSARNPGANPRSLGTLGELFTVEISGCDPTGLADEKKQYVATRLLLDAWLRAVYLAAKGTYEVLSSDWVIEKKEARFGACVRLVCSIQAKVPDLEHVVAPVDTHAEIDVEELDVTETQTIEPGA